MKRTVKRILGIALSVMILLSLLPAGVYAATETDADKILSDAYALEKGTSLSYTATLTGKITSIKDPYNSSYKNISVIIEVPGYADKPMLCYRIKGDGADKLAVGDTITVTGTIINYNGTIEFQQGCTLDNVVSGSGVAAVAPEDPKQIVDEAFALAGGKSLPYSAKLTGKIVSVDSPYDKSYKNLTVTIEVEGSTGKKNIECYRLKGTGAETLKVGDVIVVEGIIQRYIKTDSETGDVITDKVEFNGPSLVEIKTDILEEPEPTDTDYYLFGYINGDDYGCYDTMDIIGEYKFVDGKLTAFFTQDSYVGVKTGDNATFYMTDGWLGFNTTSAILYDNTTVFMPDKLYVPADTALEFTLTENGDGTLTLSYEPLTKPTEPSTKPTEPSTEPTEPSTEPTEPSTEPTEPSTKPTEPSTKPIGWGPDSLALVGEGIPGISVWDPADPAGDMIQVSDNVYEYILECPEATLITFKIAGNDQWDDDWNFGYHYSYNQALAFGQELKLYCGSAAGNLSLEIQEPCTLRFTVDLNPMVYGENATLLVEKIVSDNRKLTVKIPDSWNGVYAYTWEPEILGSFPGTAMQRNGDVYQTMVSNSMVYLLLASARPDGTYRCTEDIRLQPDGQDITITVNEDCSYIIGDLPPESDTYRVAGNAVWMGDWYAANTVGVMTEIAPDVYQKCFEDVQPGSYEFKITKDGKWDNAYGKADGSNYQFVVNSLCDVTVTLTLQDSKGIVDVTLSTGILGDVTGDGNINMGDLSQIYAHIRGTKLMSEQALLCADFNGDGKINMGDISNVYAYVRGTDPRSIVDAAYGLGENQEMSKDSTLTGTVIEVIEPYNAKYGCVTVKMTVAGREDYPILCSRLMGIDAENIGINDKIKVTGRLRNFYGTVEFKEGCQLVSWENVPSPEEEMAAIVDAAYALGNNESMDRSVTLTGKIVSVDQAYNGSLPYISVTIAVSGKEDKPISCYRMVGEQIAQVKKGDTVTVSGVLRNFYGNIEFGEGCRLESYIPGNTGAVETDPLKIVDLAYALGKDQEMAYDVTLTGKVISFKEAYNEQYKSITVMLQVRGRESKPILLYGLKGDGVASVAVDDTITVIGRLKNYNGTVEMVNCTMTNRVSGGGKPPVRETTPASIMAAAKKLAENEELPYTVTLTGKVTSFDQAYDPEYKNVSVIISVTGTSDSLLLYRMKGIGVDKLAVNDTITVIGNIRNYYGSIELVSGEMTNRVSGGGKPPVAQNDYTKIVDEAYALEQGASLTYTATLEGKIVELKTPYDAQYKNMTVVIVVTGREDKPIECYRLKGDNIGNHLCVGDTITVEGKIRNYNGTIEFDPGCQMTDHKTGSTVKPTNPEQIVDAAFQLGENEVLPYFATLTGTVNSIDEPYNDMYKNIILTMTVQGTDGPKDIVCYRLKGDGAENITIGSTITVTGAIKRYVRDKDGVYEDFVEFDSGCILESLQY